MAWRALRGVLAAWGACLCLAWLTADAMPVPALSIHTIGDWQDALGGGGGGGGKIVPVSAEEFARLVRMDLDPDKWPEEYRLTGAPGARTLFATPELTVPSNGRIEKFGTRTEPALVMHWGHREDAAGSPLALVDLNGIPITGPPTEGDRVAAAWDYVYPEDPDLRGMELDFSIQPPFFCTIFSLNILDKWGNYREWTWHSSDALHPDDPAWGHPAIEVPPGLWTTVSVDPVTGWSNYQPLSLFTVIGNDPLHQSFDLSQVTQLRFNENGRWSPDFWELPPGGQGFAIWNAWDHVDVHPEPCTLLLLGGGLLGMLARRRARK